jgi:hypothetical protein
MERELQPAGRFEWERVVRRCLLPKDTKLVAFTCATYADPDGSRVRPGVPRLAAVAGMGQSTLRRHLQALAEIGLLERVSHGGGHGRERGARWRLTVPSDLLDRVQLLDLPESTPMYLLAPAALPAGRRGVVESPVRALPAQRAGEDAGVAVDVDTALLALAQVGECIEELMVEREAWLRAAARRIGDDYRAGRLDTAGLTNGYERYRKAARGVPGFGRIWHQETGVHPGAAQSAARHAPSGPGRSWQGAYPIEGGRPPDGQAVVYVLYDELNEPCYVGSTDVFVDRLRQHVAAGKAFAYWSAWPCPDRETAYQREDDLLRQVKPYLNRRAGR